jgi:hypothetical protein
MKRKQKEWENGAVTDYFLEYYLSTNPLGLCTLCGQTGIIDTTGVQSPIGTLVGRKNFCVCPNGQALRAVHQNDITKVKV